MKSKYGLAVLVILAWLASSNISTCWAQEAVPTPNAADQVQSLKNGYQEIEKRLDALEAQSNTQAGAAAPVSFDALGNPLVAGFQYIDNALEGGNEYFAGENKRMEVSNSAGNSVFSVGAFIYFQYNNFYGPPSRYLLNDVGKNPNEFDGFLFRKLHLYFLAYFDHVWGMSFSLKTFDNASPDLGMNHAYLYAELSKALVIKAGKFTNVLSLEGLQANVDLLFAEDSLVGNLVVNKDIGIMVSGSSSHFIDYALEVANGTQDGLRSSESPLQPDHGLKAVTGRVFFTPFRKSEDPFERDWLRGFGFGIGGSVDDESNSLNSQDNLPWSRVQTSLGQNTFLVYNGLVHPQGAFYHWDPQFYYFNGSFGLQGEYVESIQTVGFDDSPSVQLTNAAWEIQSSWVFGGRASFSGARIDHPFDLSSGGLGALELAVRVHQLAVDVDSFTTNFPYNGGHGSLAQGPELATALTLGVNWHLNRHFKWMFDWERTDFSGGNLTINPEELFVFRAQMGF